MNGRAPCAALDHLLVAVLVVVRLTSPLASLTYLLYAGYIVLVRGASRLLGMERLLAENCLGHFFAVLCLGLALSGLLLILRPRPLSPTVRAWREVDLDALRHNAAVLQAVLSPGQKLMAVVKADAYGHGAVQTARCLQRGGVRAFAVACLSEGIALRRAGIQGTILILGYTPPEAVPLLRRWRLTQAVADEAHGHALAAQGRPVRVHLALDTGMHRLGIPPEDHGAIRRLFSEKHLVIRGVFSHLCVSDDLQQSSYTQLQLDRFYDALSWMRISDLDPGDTHIQASYGILNLPPQPCRYARAGILLYGVRSGGEPTAFWPDLRPALSLRARVATVRRLNAGESAGYGLAFRVDRPTVLAVITIGYGDGLPRELSQRGGGVLIRGRRCPLAGRMCMDQLFADVTELPEVHPGDRATIIGSDGTSVIPAEEPASLCGTITNELLSALSRRLPLVSVGGRSP